MQSIIGNVNESLHAPKTSASRVFGRMSATNLSKIIEVVYGHNKSQKMAIIKGTVYTEGPKKVRNRRVAGDSLAAPTEASINYTIANEFGNDKGDVQWTDLGIGCICICICIVIIIISFFKVSFIIVIIIL